MTLNKKYTIFLTTTFKKELNEIIYYIKYNLKEPSIAKKLYEEIINKIFSLQFMPERHKLVKSKNSISINLRNFQIKNFIVIYEIKKDTRKNLHSTYFSQYSKLLF